MVTVMEEKPPPAPPASDFDRVAAHLGDKTYDHIGEASLADAHKRGTRVLRLPKPLPADVAAAVRAVAARCAAAQLLGYEVELSPYMRCLLRLAEFSPSKAGCQPAPREGGRRG